MEQYTWVMLEMTDSHLEWQDTLIWFFTKKHFFEQMETFFRTDGVI